LGHWRVAGDGISPATLAGILSGILQSGYSVGYLLAAVVARFVLPTWGWRPMFWLGGLPALLAFYISAACTRIGSLEAASRAIDGRGAQDRRRSVEKLPLSCAADDIHDVPFARTQDLYPDSSGSVHKFTPALQSYMAIIYNIGAILGAIVFGQFSERLGRRRTMITAMTLSLLVIPLWAFGGSLLTLIVGSFLMQAGVQGAWGVIPVHLSELSPDETRGLVPGLAYQLGILIAAPPNTVEFC